MTDGGPLWLKIVVASVPLIAALIAGVFALTNTVNRRVERLKTSMRFVRNFLTGSILTMNLSGSSFASYKRLTTLQHQF
jgi:hypothetical protein